MYDEGHWKNNVIASTYVEHGTLQDVQGVLVDPLTQVG